MQFQNIGLFNGKDWFYWTMHYIYMLHVLWFVLFVWLFVVFRPTKECFTHIETSSLPVKDCNLTYTRNSWPLSGEGSLACNIYCDTGHLFIMVIPAVTTCFNDIDMSLLGFEHPTFCMWGDHSNRLCFLHW